MPQIEVLDKLLAQWDNRSQGEQTAIAVAGGAATVALGALLYRK